MTAVVDTPEGVRQESTVVQVKSGDVNGILGENINSVATGEAIPLDLGNRRILFVLLTSPRDPTFAYGIAPGTLLPDPPDKSGTLKAYATNLRALVNVKDAGTILRKNYPRMVRFGSLADPTSVEEVDPDNLAATFGHGVHLRSITIQLTDEPRTDGRIVKILPWIGDYAGSQFDRRPHRYSGGTLANDLSSIDFAGEMR